MIFHCSQCQFLQLSCHNRFRLVRTVVQVQWRAAVAQAVVLRKMQDFIIQLQCKWRVLDSQFPVGTSLALQASHLPRRHQWAAIIATCTSEKIICIVWWNQVVHHLLPGCSQQPVQHVAKYMMWDVINACRHEHLASGRMFVTSAV